MTTLEIISLLTIIAGLITVAKFSIKLLSIYKELIENEVNIKRDIKHLINDSKQNDINLDIIVKQFDNRLDSLEKELIAIKTTCNLKH